MATDLESYQKVLNDLSAACAKHRCESWRGRSTMTLHDTNPCGSIVNDNYRSWDRSIAVGHSYMVGEDRMTLQQYLKGHTSALSPWQKAYWEILWANPEYSITREGGGYFWNCYRRGEYVQFSLPHHDSRGEKDWISRDGKTKVLINVD